MKLLFFTGSQHLKGGTERALADIANLLIEDLNCDVEILSLYAGKTSYYPLNPNIFLSELHESKPEGVFSALANFFHIWTTVKKRNPDVLVAVESLAFLYFIIFCLFPSRCKPILICWEHFNADIDLGMKSRRFARWLAIQFAERIIVLSEQDKKLWIDKLNCPAHKLTQIYNVNPFDKIVTDTTDSSDLDIKHHRENSFNINSKRVILAAGRLSHQKGFDLLLQAWSEIHKQIRQGWTLRILGEGEQRPKLDALISSLNLADDVEIPGQSDNIQAEYENARLFVLSSRFEGFGLVLVEALSFGLPVLSFDCPAGPNEIVCNGENGYLVPTKNISALAERLTELMSQQDKLQELKKNTVSSVNKFSRTTIANEWKSFLYSLHSQ